MGTSSIIQGGFVWLSLGLYVFILMKLQKKSGWRYIYNNFGSSKHLVVTCSKDFVQQVCLVLDGYPRVGNLCLSFSESLWPFLLHKESCFIEVCIIGKLIVGFMIIFILVFH